MPRVEVASVEKFVRTDEYWQLVERAYVEVLEGGDSKPVKDLRRRLAERPQEEQLLFYHEEPLNVALDLFERLEEEPIEPSGTQIMRYQDIARGLRWPINPQQEEQAPD